MIDFYTGTIGSKEQKKIGERDFTLDMFGWEKAGNEFAKIYADDVKNSVMPENAVMVSFMVYCST